MAVALILAACTAGHIERLPYRDASLILPREQVVAFKKRAWQGDGEAAYELFWHYSWGLKDDARGEPWLRLANRLGSSSAKRYIAEWRRQQPEQCLKFERQHKLPKPHDVSP